MMTAKDAADFGRCRRGVERPGRGQHDALAVGIGQRKVNGILDADIAGGIGETGVDGGCQPES
jgi:hypothetical protein